MKNALVFFLSSLPVFFFTACSSGPRAPEKLDHVTNSATGDNREQLGLRDDKVMIQKKIYLEEQLLKLKSDVDDLQLSIYGASKQNPGGLWDGLKDCRKRMADPRVGGTGKPEPMEKWSSITEKEEDFFFQLDKKTNNFVGVSEEALDERLARYKKFKRVLEDQYETYKDKLDLCENNYSSALVQHGLNPNDTKAQGEWVDGPKGYKVWKMKRGATKDPEELMRRKVQGEEAPATE
jgi:hypothetical protein